MKYGLLSFAFAAVMLSGCGGPMIMGTDAAIIYMTKPGAPPAADTDSQIPAHETWCYRTLGDPQCYPNAQDIPADRLINVEPQNRYPLTAQAHRDEVAGRRARPAVGDPVVLRPMDKVLPVEEERLKEEIKNDNKS